MKSAPVAHRHADVSAKEVLEHILGASAAMSNVRDAHVGVGQELFYLGKPRTNQRRLNRCARHLAKAQVG